MRYLRAILTSAALWVVNRFEGATHSTSRSHIPHVVQSARFEVSASSRGEIVRRSQYFEENSDILNRMADLFETYTTGSGLQLNPSSSSPEWNKAAKAWLEEWSDYCEINSLEGFGTVQGLMARKWFIDGEIFIALVNGESNRPRLQLIEQHLVATPPHLKDMEGVSVIDGVQIDARGRPIGYYIAEEDARGKRSWGAPKPASQIIHLFERTRPGQYRGLPFVYPVINTIHDLDDLRILEMRKAKDAADKKTVFKTKNGEAPNQAALIRQAYDASRTISTGATVSESRSKYYDEATGGKNIILFRGDEAEQFKSESPSAATQWFWRNLKEEACSGVGIPYCLVYPETLQGTVYRGALDMANAFFRARSAVIQNVLRRIYQTHVMRWAIQNVPELRNPPKDWKRVSIRAPRGCNVDVGRNSTAFLAELAVGAADYETHFGALGLDWREQFDKLKEQQDYAAEIGLKLTPEPTPEEAGPQMRNANPLNIHVDARAGAEKTVTLQRDDTGRLVGASVNG